jgi:hypothetical protein
MVASPVLCTLVHCTNQYRRLQHGFPYSTGGSPTCSCHYWIPAVAPFPTRCYTWQKDKKWPSYDRLKVCIPNSTKRLLPAPLHCTTEDFSQLHQLSALLLGAIFQGAAAQDHWTTQQQRNRLQKYYFVSLVCKISQNRGFQGVPFPQDNPCANTLLAWSSPPLGLHLGQVSAPAYNLASSSTPPKSGVCTAFPACSAVQPTKQGFAVSTTDHGSPAQS